VLNVQSDHLGLKGIDTLEQLGELKRIVVEVATDCAVLNADDPLVLKMSGYTEAKNICYVTMNPQHALVREHIRAGGRACALEAGVNGQMITLYDRGGHIPLLWTHLIPATLEGRATHNVQNAMFAAAMAFSLGIKLDAIRQGLRTFDSTFFQAPGRMNVFNEHPFKVLFDYGHNAHAVGMMADLARASTSPAGASSCSRVPATGATRTWWRSQRPLPAASITTSAGATTICAIARRTRCRASRRRPARRGRPRERDLDHSRRAGGDRRGAAHGPAGRPAADFRRCPGALLETDHQVQAERAAARNPRRRAATARRASVAEHRDSARHRFRGERRRTSISKGSSATSAAFAWRRRAKTERPHALPFEDSRRLTGGNLFFASTGAVLEPWASSMMRCSRRGAHGRARRCAPRLGSAAVSGAAARGGASLAIAAPARSIVPGHRSQRVGAVRGADRARSEACRSLEEALAAASLEGLDRRRDPARIAPVLEESAALARFVRLAPSKRGRSCGTARGRCTARTAARARRIGAHAGRGCRRSEFSLGALPPTPGEFPGRSCATSQRRSSPVPTARRRRCACWPPAHGRTAGTRRTTAPTGYFSTMRRWCSGDYSGPAGARMVMREPRAQAAILETARGGILRRGIAVSQARVAVVTNVSSDHFGEYGIDDLAPWPM
jgi:hypothetical protein